MSNYIDLNSITRNDLLDRKEVCVNRRFYKLLNKVMLTTYITEITFMDDQF